MRFSFWEYENILIIFVSLLSVIQLLSMHIAQLDEDVDTGESTTDKNSKFEEQSVATGNFLSWDFPFGNTKIF